MRFKIDTKAHYRVLTFLEACLDANLAEELIKENLTNFSDEATSLIIDLTSQINADEEGIKAILTVYGTFYANNASCVLVVPHVSLRRKISRVAEETDLNITPSLAEAIDIIMMEHLERSFNSPGNA